MQKFFAKFSKIAAVIIPLALAFSGAVMSFSASAADTDDNQFTYTVNSDNTATITNYRSSERNAAIPSVITVKAADGTVTAEYVVTAIGAGAFSTRGTLQNVIIPASVKTIGSEAFRRCPNLTTVKFGDGSVVNSIAANAFSESLQVKFESLDNAYVRQYALANNITVTLPGAASTLYVMFSLNDWTGGTVPATQTTIPSGFLYNPGDPSRVGYAFKGWFDNKAGTGSAWNFLTSKVSKDMVLYAKWEAISYAVNYNPNGGTLPADAPKTYAYANGITLATPVRTDYDFAGWYTKADFSGSQVPMSFAANSTNISSYLTPPASATASPTLTLYAKWAKKLAPPANLTAKSTSYKTILLSWDAVTGASGYNIYYSTTQNGIYRLLGTLQDGTAKSKSYTNFVTGNTYYFKIAAYADTADAVSNANYSDVVSEKPTLKTPKSVKAAAVSSTSLKITWAKVTGANGYEIYRCTTKDGTYKKVKTFTSGSTVSYTNTGLTKNKEYYYKVIAYRNVDGKKVYSSYSTAVNAKTLK